MLAARASALARPRAWSSSLIRLKHTFTELPEDWRKLSARAVPCQNARERQTDTLCEHLAEVPALEVMDTSELDSLIELSAQEKVRLTELRVVAKAQQRKVLRVNCDLDMKRVDRLHGYIDHVQKDKRRLW